MTSAARTPFHFADVSRTARSAASPAPAPADRPGPLAPEPPAEARLAAIKAAPNPLLEAAQPLLRALADLPQELPDGGLKPLQALLAREVSTFQALCNDAQIKHEHVVAASYALCTALDEAANSTPWGGAREGEQGSQAGEWAANQLAVTFHGDIHGGEKFFLLVGRLAASPQEHADLLELMYQVLGLGFEGRYKAANGGPRQLETIRQRLRTLLLSARGDVPHPLSPHWRGESAGRLRVLRSVPVWVTASMLGLVLLGLFGWYKYQLAHAGAAVEARIEAIGRMRAPAAAETVAGKPLRLKELLADEIARGTVNVEEDGRHSTVTFKGDDMFVPGQARVNARMTPLLNKVADEIKQVTGTVQVIGHSDNVPIRTSEFPSNQVLSEKRAVAVAGVLQARGVDAQRIQTRGRGDTTPVADNATAAGRARNRRVDIVVTQGPVSADAVAAPNAGPVASKPVAPPPAPAATPSR